MFARETNSIFIVLLTIFIIPISTDCNSVYVLVCATNYDWFTNVIVYQLISWLALFTITGFCVKFSTFLRHFNTLLRATFRIYEGVIFNTLFTFLSVCIIFMAIEDFWHTWIYWSKDKEVFTIDTFAEKIVIVTILDFCNTETILICKAITTFQACECVFIRNLKDFASWNYALSAWAGSC